MATLKGKSSLGWSRCVLTLKWAEMCVFARKEKGKPQKVLHSNIKRRISGNEYICLQDLL